MKNTFLTPDEIAVIRTALARYMENPGLCEYLLMAETVKEPCVQKAAAKIRANFKHAAAAARKLAKGDKQ